MPHLKMLSDKVRENIQLKINVDDVKRLYQPENSGGICFRDVLPLEFLAALTEEIQQFKCQFSKVADTTEKVKQNVWELYVGPEDRKRARGVTSIITLNQLPLLEDLSIVYAEGVYNRVASSVHFERTDRMHSVGIHRYPAVNGGISFHKDYSSDVNLVGIFSVEGRTRFSLAETREGGNSLSYDRNPGDLTLMRAHRNYSEEELGRRPFHKIETIGEEAVSVVLRSRRKNGEKQNY